MKNAERYITPELKAFEDKALSARERALAREKVLYDELLDALAPAIPAAAARRRARRRARRARGLRRTRATRSNLAAPEFTAERVHRDRGGPPPGGRSQVEHFIPNDTQLCAARQLLLITGPNMGGKSTYMRQVALIALLAHCGRFVPARARDSAPIDQIFTRIGASDDLAGGRSTFMVEMTEAA